MKNFVMEKANGIPMTAPAGGVVSGGLYIIGAIPVIARVSAAAGATFAASIGGGFALPKVAGLAIAEGVAVYWDAGAGNVTTTAAGNTKIGFAGQGGALAADASILVFLNGTV